MNDQDQENKKVISKCVGKLLGLNAFIEFAGHQNGEICDKTISSLYGCSGSCRAHAYGLVLDEVIKILEGTLCGGTDPKANDQQK